MIKKRSIRHRKKRSKRKVLDLDITSLLDILVIILVFLLKSYNTSGVIINVPQNVRLPLSQSKKMNTPGVSIQVSENKIWVDDELIIQDINSKNLFDHGGRRIIPLFDKLTKKRQTVELVNKKTSYSKKFQGSASLVIDKNVGYHLIRKVLYTAAESKFIKYKFVVLSDEK